MNPHDYILTHGSHASEEDGVCARELLHLMVTGKHADATPQCLTGCCSLLPALNDGPWTDDAHRTRVLLPYLSRLMECKRDKKQDIARAFLLADIAVREIAAEALDVAGLQHKLCRLAPITSAEMAEFAAAEAGEAAGVAARVAAGVVAGIAWAAAEAAEAAGAACTTAGAACTTAGAAAEAAGTACTTAGAAAEDAGYTAIVAAEATGAAAIERYSVRLLDAVVSS